MKPFIRHGMGAALVAGVVMLAAACGGKDEAAEQAAAAQAAADSAAAAQPATPLPTQLDACALLTSAEAQEIVGKAVAGPTRNQTNDQVCEYKVEGGMGGTFQFATQMVYAANAADELAAQLKESGITTTEEPGLGERSFWAPQPNMTQLNTFQSGNHIMLTLGYMGNETKQRDIARKIMTKVLEKQAAAPAAPTQPAPQQ